MEKIKKIIQHPKYIESINKLKEYEKERVFCNHTLEHFIDVARIMYIISLENGDKIDKELIYATALLHDIGRLGQYEEGIPHHIAGHAIIKDIMSDAGFDESDIKRALKAIENHRNVNGSDDLLGEYLYCADKKSRNCFHCVAYNECNWSEDKKNMTIEW